MSFPRHPNESARLEALKRFAILDTLPEQEYEDIVRLAATICRTPPRTSASRRTAGDRRPAPKPR